MTLPNHVSYRNGLSSNARMGLISENKAASASHVLSLQSIWFHKCMTFDNETRSVRTNLNFSLVVTTVCTVRFNISEHCCSHSVFWPMCSVWFGLCVQYDLAYVFSMIWPMCSAWFGRCIQYDLAYMFNMIWPMCSIWFGLCVQYDLAYVFSVISKINSN